MVNRFVKNGKIVSTDRSLRVPRPFTLGYAAYCKPFCQWLTDRALESGVELRTAVTATDVVREKGKTCGLVTDRKETIRADIIIDVGGTQNPLSIKADIREKYDPEAIELYMIWDLAMDRADVDEVFGHSMEFFHGMPEEKIGAPLGYGSTFYVFTYRNSIHPGLGQFLRSLGNRRLPL